MTTTNLKTLLTTLSIALAAIVATDAHADSANASLGVSAAVVANCMISTTDLNFGIYDPIGEHADQPLSGTGTLTVSCTMGTAANLLLDGGEYDTSGDPNEPNRQMKSADDHMIEYGLYSDAAHNAVWGAGEATCIFAPGTGGVSEHIVYGSIPAGQLVPIGDYSDVVLATVMF